MLFLSRQSSINATKRKARQLTNSPQHCMRSPNTVLDCGRPSRHEIDGETSARNWVNAAKTYQPGTTKQSHQKTTNPNAKWLQGIHGKRERSLQKAETNLDHHWPGPYNSSPSWLLYGSHQERRRIFIAGNVCGKWSSPCSPWPSSYGDTKNCPMQWKQKKLTKIPKSL